MKPKTIEVAGLTVENILNLDVNTLGEKDLRAVATRLVSASNKRVRRLAKTPGGKLSPAYARIEKRGRMFSVKGKDISGLRAEMAQMRSFMRLKTSTVTGWKKVKRYMFLSKFGARISEAQINEFINKFWTVYRNLEESMGGVIGSVFDSNKIQSMLYDEMFSEEPEDDIIEKMIRNMDQEYDKIMQQEDEEDGNDKTGGDVFDLKGVF
jgi:hypothetical protein